MMVLTACHVPPTASATPLRPTASLSRPQCPQCGNTLLMAEESWFNAGGRIDHVWACDDCGNAFVTSVTLWHHSNRRSRSSRRAR